MLWGTRAIAASIPLSRAFGDRPALQSNPARRRKLGFELGGLMLRDVKTAIVLLLRSPGFAATAILMLALGIGATTAIFSVVESVLLRPLPFPHPEQLVVLSDRLNNTQFGGTAGEAGVTSHDILAYSRSTHSFTALGGYGYSSYELSGIGDAARINAARMTAGVFAALDVPPLLGRVFTAQEDEQKQRVVVLSYATWSSRFQRDPNILGRKILLDRAPYIVTGVMPRTFEFPFYSGHANQSELWVPMSFTADELGAGAAGWDFAMVGRLKPGITADQAQSDAEQVAQQIMREYPAFMASMRISAVVRSLHEDLVAQVRPLIRTLFFAVGVVLLIACANLASLLLVRSLRRRREIAVRLAIGARGAALLRQVLLESLVLSLTGGALGLLLATILVRIGRSLLPETLPRLDNVGIDWNVALFALFLAILTGLLCGLAPAFAALRTNVNEVLRQGGRTGTPGAGYARLRAVLVVGEIAIALALLCASGLLLRSFSRMRAVHLGFQPDHALVAWFSLPQAEYPSQSTVNLFHQQLLGQLQQLPGAVAAGISDQLPASGTGGTSFAFVVEGYVPPAGTPMNLAWPSNVAGDYFQAMDIPLLAGRLFTPADTAGAQPVVVVNRTLADRFWPGQNPLGRHIRWGLQESPAPWMTVVGVVGDVKQSRPDQATRDQIYETAVQADTAFGSLASPDDLTTNNGVIVLRTSLPAEQMENALRSTVHSIDAQLPLTRMETMDHAISDSEAPRRFNTVVISAFAGAAVLLAVLGIYSVIAFSVALRSQEMAIRLALGSQRIAIRRLVLGWAAKMALAGCLIGLAASLAASRLLRSFVFDVSPFDPLVLTVAAVSVLLLAVAAALRPALRAGSVDPTQAIRSE